MCRIWLVVVTLSAVCIGQTVFDFENTAVGSVPAGWKVEATTVRLGKGLCYDLMV